ncbi:C40 family peptidase [Tessaracoccus aquimaris]|uniref:C40 family peptidase n=1 Tax=Tessaracoccus aquimaris TaxID=1332264 RepID=UPI0011AB6268|nr:C40 family peptidase [Tessaracoccus aquimaris]
MNRVRLVLASTLAIATVFGGAVVANADPDAVAQARKDLDRIHQESSAIDQDIIEAHDRAAQNEAKLKNLTSDVTSQVAKVEKLSSQLGHVGAVQMRGDSISLTAQLLTSTDADNFLSGLGAMQVEADRSTAGIQQLQVDQAKLTTLREDVDATQKQLDKDAAAKVELGKQYDAKEAEAQAVYDRLSEEERQRLAAIEAERVRREAAAQAEAEARAAQERASRDTATSPRVEAPASTSPSAPASSKAPKPETQEEPPAASGGSGRAQDVVDAALSKVGSRYVWGTSGPSTFDCSGLTSWAYRQVGINLTRSSRGQFSSAGYKVSKSDLRPGDLVFYYSPVSHVGLYIGNGKIVDAANPRSGVRVTSLNSMPFSGARRVIG